MAKEPSIAFHIALEKQEETWRLHTLHLDAFSLQPGEAVPTFTYVYEQAVFLAGAITGEVAATWLTTLTIQLDGIWADGNRDTIQIPSLQEHVNWQRYPRNTYYASWALCRQGQDTWRPAFHRSAVYYIGISGARFIMPCPAPH